MYYLSSKKSVFIDFYSDHSDSTNNLAGSTENNSSREGEGGAESGAHDNPALQQTEVYKFWIKPSFLFSFSTALLSFWFISSPTSIAAPHSVFLDTQECRKVNKNNTRIAKLCFIDDWWYCIGANANL